MAQVSKRYVPVEVKNRIFIILWKTLADIKFSGDIKSFLTDLLSDTEIIMIAKRLAIAVMLSKGCSYRTIKDTLKVSTTTIMLISTKMKLQGKGYQLAVKKLVKDEKISAFLDKIGDSLDSIVMDRPYSPQWQKQQIEKRKQTYQREIRKTL